MFVKTDHLIFLPPLVTYPSQAATKEQLATFTINNERLTDRRFANDNYIKKQLAICFI